MDPKHAENLKEILYRIGGKGPAYHMPLDTLRIVEALLALTNETAQITDRLQRHLDAAPKEPTQ